MNTKHSQIYDTRTAGWARLNALALDPDDGGPPIEQRGKAGRKKKAVEAAKQAASQANEKQH